MKIYWPAVYAFLRRSGQDRESAAEITQSFFVSKLVEGDLFHRFDSSRGRLRSLLLRAIKNYMIDMHRIERRGGGNELPFHQEHDEQFGDRTPEESFEQRWAIAQLEEAVRRCRSYFVGGGRCSHWEAFEDRVYGPAVYCSDPTPLESLAERLDFKNAANAAAAVQLVRRRVVVFLREVVNDTVSDPDLAEDEFGRAVEALRGK